VDKVNRENHFSHADVETRSFQGDLIVTRQVGNLSAAERAASAVTGLLLTLISARRGAPLIRAATAVAGVALLARSYAGHCGMKAAATGHTSLLQGLADQWRLMSGRAGPTARGLPGSPAHAAASGAIDESVDESFPASDPPASRIPDEPPSNAEAKWAAARKAGLA
jgi:hypothetical protein